MFQDFMSVHDQATGPSAGFSFSPKFLILGGFGLIVGRTIGYCILHLKLQIILSSSVTNLLIIFSPGVRVNPRTLAVVYLLAMLINMSFAIPQQREHS